MSELAVVVLAHADPVHLKRLVDALDDLPIFLHCDAKTSAATYGQMLDTLPPRVVVCPRLRTTLASWSLVEAELLALREALAHSRAQHIAVLSGADYPLVSVQELVDEVERWEGHSLLWNQRMPYGPWNTPRNRDGGLWRLQHRFLIRRDQIVYIRQVPLRWPTKRQTPPGLELRASSQWKVYARHHAELLVRVAETRPDLVQFWRTTLVPEESFAASVLASPHLAGVDALPTCDAHPWYLDWPEGSAHHPRWLGSDDFDALSRARWAAPALPSGTLPGQAAPGACRKWFARKFSSRHDVTVLDRIDAELRQRSDFAP